jgi:uncharacterized protein (DUF58 family)
MLVLGTMLIGAINYNNNLAFLFTFLLSSMVFISLFHTHRTLSGLTFLSGHVAPVYAGGTAILSLLLRPGNRPRSGLRFRIAEDTSVETGLDGPFDMRVDIPFTVTKRGRYTIDSITVTTSYPFGLFQTWSTFHPDISYLVYPGIVPGPFNPSTSPDNADNSGTVSIEGVDDFKGLRPYRPGDPQSRLSWKSLARGKGLHAKEFEQLAGTITMIRWEDIHHSDPEKRISRLADMVNRAHRMDLSYGLSLPGITIPPGEPKDPGHRHLCLRELALMNTGETP